MAHDADPELRAFVSGDCFVTGEPLIDRQHHELVELINSLGRVVVRGAPVGDMSALSALDALTGLPNRRHARQVLDTLWQTPGPVAAERLAPSDTAGDLLRRADAALYAAKRAWRDRLASAGAPPLLL